MRTPDQRRLFREALDEGVGLRWAMIVAGYSRKAARQGRAKLCSTLLLDYEDWEREQKKFEENVRKVYERMLWEQLMGLPLRGIQMQLLAVLSAEVARLKRRDRAWSRRNPTIVFRDARGHETVLHPKPRWRRREPDDRGDEQRGTSLYRWARALSRVIGTPYQPAGGIACTPAAPSSTISQPPGPDSVTL